MHSRRRHRRRYNLELFDKSVLPRGGVVCIVGDKCTGKSSLAFQFSESSYQPGDSVTLFDHRLVDPRYPQKFTNFLHFDSWNRQFVYQVLKEQDLSLKLKKGRHEPTRANNRIFVVEETLINDAFFKDPMVQDIFVNGRRLGVTLVLCTQSIRNISADFCLHIDLFTMTGAKSTFERRNLYLRCGGCILGDGDYKKFERFLKENTRGNKVLLYSQYPTRMYCSCG